MEYGIDKLAGLSGVSARTLRYYGQIGLLPPARVDSTGRRFYGAAQVDKLQQILFYKALGVELKRIAALLGAPDYDRLRALEEHLALLIERRAGVDALIRNASMTIMAMKGEKTMSDQEKFEGLKRAAVDENERKYGTEVRARYGGDAVDASNAHFMGMKPDAYARAQALEGEVMRALAEAMAAGGPDGPKARHACALHEAWLKLLTPNYTRAYHRGLGQMYAADARFSAYYDAVAPGCAQFLCDALDAYCKKAEPLE